MSDVEPSIKQEEAPEPTEEAVELDTDISLEDWLAGGVDAEGL